MAAGARALGAVIRRQSKVVALSRLAKSGWRIEVEGAEVIEADRVVNCGGQWAPELARLAGSDLPITPMLHQYMVTEKMPEIAALDVEFPVIRDRENSFYLRQERQGLLVGPYEKNPKVWMPRGIPPEFGQELLPDDMDRLEDGMMAAINRVPALETAGIARVVNGPIPYTPDEKPLTGPHPGLPDMWLCCGTAIGIIQGGGMGYFLAQWMVEGATEWDPYSVHPARFGDYVTTDYTIARAHEAYAKHYEMVPYPGLELPAGRPARTTALYDQQKVDGAVFGCVNGWERPLWFAPIGVDAVDSVDFKRPESFKHVAAEHMAARESVALFYMSIFGKYTVTGPDARTWVDSVFTGKAPAAGRSSVSFLCDVNGNIAGDFAVTSLHDDHFYITGAGGSEGVHWDMLDRLKKGDMHLSRDVARFGVLHLAGPNSRALLSDLVAEDVSNEAMPFLSTRALDFGLCRALTFRVSFSGDLGYEIHVPVEYQRALYERVKEMGRKHGLRLAGGRALHSLRLEKGWLFWGSDLTGVVDPYQAGLGFMVSLKKNPDFPGRAALERKSQTGPTQRLQLLEVETDGIDCIGGEPIFRDGVLIGQVTSGGYGAYVGKSMAVGWVQDRALNGSGVLEIDLYGKLVRAHVLAHPPFDPQDERLRG